MLHVGVLVVDVVGLQIERDDLAPGVFQPERDVEALAVRLGIQRELPQGRPVLLDDAPEEGLVVQLRLEGRLVQPQVLVQAVDDNVEGVASLAVAEEDDAVRGEEGEHPHLGLERRALGDVLHGAVILLAAVVLLQEIDVEQEASHRVVRQKDADHAAGAVKVVGVRAVEQIVEVRKVDRVDQMLDVLQIVMEIVAGLRGLVKALVEAGDVHMLAVAEEEATAPRMLLSMTSL